MKSNYDVLGNHIRLIDNRNKDSYNEKDIYSNGFCALHDDACRG